MIPLAQADPVYPGIVRDIIGVMAQFDRSLVRLGFNRPAQDFRGAGIGAKIFRAPPHKGWFQPNTRCLYAGSAPQRVATDRKPSETIS